MTISRSLSLTVGSLALLALTVACGAAPTSSGFTRATKGNGNGDGVDDDPSQADDGNGPKSSFGTIVDGGNRADAACATSSASATNLPVYLVFIYDQSGSMKDDSKWSSCKQGIESFFASPSSAGLNASIAFFPQSASTCTTGSYAKPSLAMRPLPDATSFKTNLEAITPDGTTPTLPAVQGAIQYAQEIQAQHGRDGKVAIVLVTDGDPNGCNSTPDNVAAALATVKATIPTYVIGVGKETTKLNTIATGGGTAPAIIVQTGNPNQIATDFEKAINQIKAQALSCEYEMGKPANGATLDVNAVNVVFTPKYGSGPETLTYNKDCAAGTGWHYDDATNPTKINICETSCGTFKADTGGKVDIVFGCTTQGGGPAR